MALTLTFALLTGTILALTVVPVLATFAFRKKFSAHESWIVHRLVNSYRPMLERVLKARGIFLGGAVILLVIAGIVMSRLGTEFLPKLDEGSLWVRAFLPETISPTEANRVAKRSRATLVSFP